jgi:hypothetical protein
LVAPGFNPGWGGWPLPNRQELLDLSLQLFARDRLNLALVDFLGSTPGLLDPKLPDLLFWKLIQAFEKDLRKMRAVLQR